MAAALTLLLLPLPDSGAGFSVVGFAVGFGSVVGSTFTLAGEGKRVITYIWITVCIHV